MDFLINIFPLIIMLMCSGAVAGFMAGLLGIGGGLILVPSLYYIFGIYQNDMGFDPAYLMHISVGTSLSSIIFTGASSSFAHYKKGSVDFTSVQNIGFGIICGAVLAAWFAKGLDSNQMRLIFASIILVLAIIMILDLKRIPPKSKEPHKLFDGLAGVAIGFIAALAGIGGSVLSVPYMSLRGISIHRAVGTASALGVIIALFGAVGFVVIGAGQANLPPFSLGYVNFIALPSIVITSVIFAPIGVHAAHKMSVSKLKVIFVIFMMIIALNVWRGYLFG